MSTTEQLSLGPIIGYWLSCCTFAGPACVRFHLCSKETRKWLDYSLRYVKRCLLTHLMAVQFYVPLILYDPCWIKAVRWHFKPLRSLAKTLKIAIECEDRVSRHSNLLRFADVHNTLLMRIVVKSSLSPLKWVQISSLHICTRINWKWRPQHVLAEYRMRCTLVIANYEL